MGVKIYFYKQAIHIDKHKNSPLYYEALASVYFSGEKGKNF